MDHRRLGVDLELQFEKREDELYGSVDLDTVVRRDKVDLATIEGVDNLVQAIMLRLRIPKGGLSKLGHSDYGCSLHEHIGKPNTQTTRNLIKFDVLEALSQEPRIQEILDVTVETTPEWGRVDISISIRPIEATAPLNLVFPFFLEVP